MTNRVTYDDGKDGPEHLDEIVTDAGEHLERLDRDRWFLALQRSDGTEICLCFKGKVTMIEERG
ncbi:MAG: hypothetical protein ACK5VE_03645 [Alphaproteobacteria bacterium]